MAPGDQTAPHLQRQGLALGDGVAAPELVGEPVDGPFGVGPGAAAPRIADVGLVILVADRRDPAVGGEVVVDYSLRIKRNLGSSNTWVSAYCNDVLAYIPSLRVLKEGGYEGETSMLYYGHPTKWSEQVEEDIIAAVDRLVQAVARSGSTAP